MQLEIQNPLTVEAWNERLFNFSEANIFHTSNWAKVLSKTYGYIPRYIVSFNEGKLASLMPLMHINSFITGKRGVSLPFTDVCPVLAVKDEDKRILWGKALELAEVYQWKYIETRSGLFFDSTIPVSTQFYEHQVNLQSGPEVLFQKMKSSTRRNIRRAEQSEVCIKHEHSLEAMKIFYHLHSITRKRHGMPIQPWAFFKNIWKYILQDNHGFLSMAYYANKPVASNVYFHFSQNALYKFGASDLGFQHVRPNDLIQWNAIKHFQSLGFRTLNLGRTDWGHEGLRRYKLGLGTDEQIIQYHKFDTKNNCYIKSDHRKENSEFQLKNAPICLLKLIGKFAYKHAA